MKIKFVFMLLRSFSIELKIDKLAFLHALIFILFFHKVKFKVNY